MSDLKNQTTEQEIRFAQRAEWVAYSGTFNDSANNKWRIDVSGRKDAVDLFTEIKPFSLVVKPVEVAAGAQPEPVAQGAPGYAEKKTLVASAAPAPDDRAPQPPGLDVVFTLEQPAGGPPYQVTFELDPCMTDNYDGYSFCLRGSDTSASVTYQSNGGNIQVGVSSGGKFQGSAGSVGNANIAALPHYSWCYVSVTRLSGNPCYSLSGDITVN